MAQNTERWMIGDLTIRYSPEYPINADDANKLANSLNLARRAVRRAIEALDDVSAATEVMARRGSSGRPMISQQRVAPGQALLPEVPYSALRYHFHLPSLATADALTLATWRNDALQISNEVRRIELGLLKPIVISDLWASTIGREKRSGREAAEKKIRRDNRPWSAEEKAQELRIAELQGSLEGMRKAAGTVGIVRPKKRVLMGLSDAQCAAVMDGQHLSLTPEEKGSIHMNFPGLLQDPAINTVCVARTLVHEAGHKFCDLDDVAYTHDPMYKQLSQVKALRNADSYAYTVMSLYKGHVFLTNNGMKHPPANIDMNS